MLAVISELVEDVENFGADNAREDRDDPKVPELLGIKALLAADVDDKHQPENEAERGHHAIGRQGKMANVDKSRVHVGILDVSEAQSA